MADAVTLTCTWGRAPLPVAEAPQVAYLLVEAAPTALPTAAIPLNFCLVLDRSGSMQGVKLTSMKAAARHLIETLTPEDIVAVVIYDDQVQTLVPATPVTNKPALLAAIDTINESGGTAMSLGLQAGQTELQKNASPDRLSHLLLLTDGQTWGDESICRTVAQSLGQAGIRITALGLGAEWNEKLLDDLAEATGGNSDYIAEPAQITTFFQRVVRSAQGTAATEARLLLRLIKEATPRAVHRATPTIANLGYQPINPNEVVVKLGDLVFGQTSSIVIDLMLPVRLAGSFRVAQAELSCLPVGQSQPQVVKLDVLLSFSADPAAPAYTPRVMNLVEKVMAFKLQTRALSEAEAGNVAGATQKLRAAATRLLDLGELELAEKTSKQADALEQDGALSAEGQKELKYATRRLTQQLDG